MRKLKKGVYKHEVTEEVNVFWLEMLCSLHDDLKKRWDACDTGVDYQSIYMDLISNVDDCLDRVIDRVAKGQSKGNKYVERVVRQEFGTDIEYFREYAADSIGNFFVNNRHVVQASVIGGNKFVKIENIEYDGNRFVPKPAVLEAIKEASTVSLSDDMDKRLENIREALNDAFSIVGSTGIDLQERIRQRDFNTLFEILNIVDDQVFIKDLAILAVSGKLHEMREIS